MTEGSVVFLMILTAGEIGGTLRYFVLYQTVEAQISKLHNSESFFWGCNCGT